MTDRSTVRIGELKKRVPVSTRLMNVKIPGQLSEAITRIARDIQVSKTQVVIALLKAGLERAESFSRPPRKRSGARP